MAGSEFEHNLWGLVERPSHRKVAKCLREVIHGGKLRDPLTGP